jgi:hypothetical protein
VSAPVVLAAHEKLGTRYKPALGLKFIELTSGNLEFCKAPRRQPTT